MPSAQPGNTADTAWQYCHRLALRAPVRALLVSWRFAPDSLACDQFARDTDLDAVLKSREVADQRLERKTVELSATQLRYARPIRTDQEADVVGVPTDEQARELGAELLLEHGNRIAA